MRKVLSACIAFGVVATTAAVLGVMPDAAAHPGHQISVNDMSVNEGSLSGSFTLTVTPAPEAGETVSVHVQTASFTATGAASCTPPSASSDYVNVPDTTITWNAGETTKFQSVTICEDSVIEGNETFFLNLTNATSSCPSCPTGTSANISDAQGTGTIIDNDGQPQISIGDATTTPEGNVGTTPFVFPVTLSAASASTVTVHYATADGTATAPSDYTAQSGNVSFSPGITAGNVTILVNGDTTAETDETFFVNLSSPTNAQIADPQGVGIIRNDDPLPSGPSTLTINDISLNEGNSGTTPSTPFTFTVTLSQPPAASQTSFVNFNTADGSATSGSDYTLTSGTILFTAGQTAQTITVPVTGDTTPEADEVFSVTLAGASCSGPSCTAPTISDGLGVATIVNDDAVPPTATPTPAPSPTPTPTPTPPTTVTATLKIGGYFQVRVTAQAPCAANRLVKVKKSVPGTDKVITQGNTDANGLFKQAVRPRKRGNFYGQVYNILVGGTTCKGAKSPVRTLPA